MDPLGEDLGEVVPRDDKLSTIQSSVNTKSAPKEKRKRADVTDEGQSESSPAKVARQALTKEEDVDQNLTVGRGCVVGDEEATWSGRLDAPSVQTLVDLTKNNMRYKVAYGSVLTDSVPKGWIATALLTKQEPRVFGIDCEMVVCEDNPSTLARASLVSFLLPQRCARPSVLLGPLDFGGVEVCSETRIRFAKDAWRSAL
eukprot:7312440-Pyramimonas_sp.AAC.1